MNNFEISSGDEAEKLRVSLRDKKQEILQLRNLLAERDRTIAALQFSTSWRLTAPLRLMVDLLRSYRKIPRVILSLISSGWKALRIFRREGLGGVKSRIRLLRRYAETNRGEHSELYPIVLWIFSVAKWWKHTWFRGMTADAARFKTGNIRLSFDRGPGLFSFTRDDIWISGWALDLAKLTHSEVRVIDGGGIFPTLLHERTDVKKAFHAFDLPVRTGFCAWVRLYRTGFHLLRTQVCEGGRWVTVHRSLVLFKRPPKLMYSDWVKRSEECFSQEVPNLREHIDAMIHRPRFQIFVCSAGPRDLLEKTLKSIEAQVYSNLVVHQSDSPQIRLPSSSDSLDYGVFLRAGEVLSPGALYEFASEINSYPKADAIYGDQDRVSASGTFHTPFYKPDWSPDYLETFNYLGFSACARLDRVEGAEIVGGYDLMLRATDRATCVRHVRKILGHSYAKPTVDQKMDMRALSGRLERTGRIGEVSEVEKQSGCYRIKLGIKKTPKVSIVIPTAGRSIEHLGKKIDLLENVLRQIREKSTYRNYEIVVVDNGDLSQSQLDMLDLLGCKKVLFSEPEFNIAKKLNLGAEKASGELFILMNDDIEITTPTWIEDMIAHFEKPHVGVVGARLKYPSGGDQHIGVVLNSGNPDHVRRPKQKERDAGYFFSTCGVRNFSAVTGACMMTTAEVYRRVGGYTEDLAVSYNDVDFCLKVQEAGYFSIYDPNIKLVHMESVSRIASLNFNEWRWFQTRWAKLPSDPFYNEECLSVVPSTFTPVVNGRVI